MRFKTYRERTNYTTFLCLIRKHPSQFVHRGNAFGRDSHVLCHRGPSVVDFRCRSIVSSDGGPFHPVSSTLLCAVSSALDDCDITMSVCNQSESNGISSGILASIPYSDPSIANLATEFLSDGSNSLNQPRLSPSKDQLVGGIGQESTPQLHSESESPPLHIGSWPSQLTVPCTPESPVRPAMKMPASATELTFPSSISLSSTNSPRQQLHSLQTRNTSGPTTTLSSTRTPGQKRLNWAEMICYTIYESPTGRLVIQELFEGMCLKFPEITEWASGKDWEARVKNRIKSTLSIKGNLFVKVPRPSRAGSKGSWWTLTPDAQEAFRQGCVSEAVRGSGSLNSPITTRSAIHAPSTPTTSRFNHSSNVSHDVTTAGSRPSSYHGRTMQGSDLQGGWNRTFSENRLSSNNSTTTPYWKSNLRPQARRLAPLDLNNAAMQELFGDTSSAMMSPATPGSVFSPGPAQSFTPQSATFPLSMSDTSFAGAGVSTASDSFSANTPLNNVSLTNAISTNKQPMTPVLDLDGSLSLTGTNSQELAPQPPISTDIDQTDILGIMGNTDPYQQRNVLMMLNATSNTDTVLNGGIHGDMELSGLTNSTTQAGPASQNSVFQNMLQDAPQQMGFALNMNTQIPNSGFMNPLPGYSIPDQVSLLAQINAVNAADSSNMNLSQQQLNNPANAISNSQAPSTVWNFQ